MENGNTTRSRRAAWKSALTGITLFCCLGGLLIWFIQRLPELKVLEIVSVWWQSHFIALITYSDGNESVLREANPLLFAGRGQRCFEASSSEESGTVGDSERYFACLRNPPPGISILYTSSKQKCMLQNGPSMEPANSPTILSCHSSGYISCTKHFQFCYSAGCRLKGVCRNMMHSVFLR